VPEDFFQSFRGKARGYPEHAFSVKTAVRTQHMKVWIESKKIAEGLYGNNCPRYSAIFGDGFLKELFQGFPAATAEIGEQLSVIEEIAAENFGYAEDEMAVGQGLEDFFAEPLAKLHNTFLVTGWAKMAAFA
jgi:hypothetical protein